MTWRWNAFSIRLTPTSPSRTRSELRREGISASCSDHVGPGDPVLEATLLAVETHPQKAEKQRGEAGEIPHAARRTARGRRPIAVHVDDAHLEEPHAERAPLGNVERQQIDERDREQQHQ